MNGFAGTWRRIGLTLGVAGLLAMAATAQEVWDGGGADDNWSTHGNWADDSAPINPYTGVVSFDTNDLGNANVVDYNRTVGSVRYDNSLLARQRFSAWMTSGGYTASTNGGWVAVSAAVSNDYCRLQGGGGAYLMSPRLPFGVQSITFLYQSGQAGSPATACRVELSTNKTVWTLLAEITNITATSFQRFSATVGSPGDRYVRLVNSAGTANATLWLDDVDIVQFTKVGHTTDLGGNTLVVTNGSMMVGYLNVLYAGLMDSIATVTNGTLQIGTGGSQADLCAGYTTIYCDVSNAVLNVYGTLDTVGLRNLYVGYHSFLYYAHLGQTSDSRIDLRGATINSGGAPNTLSAQSIIVGGGGTKSYGDTVGIGTLYLPSSVTQIATGDLLIGGIGSGRSKGYLEFAPNSQLNRLDVTGDFFIACKGEGEIRGWPTNVDVTVGTAEAPSSMRVGGGTRYVLDTTYCFAMTNGSFTGYLNDLLVATPLTYNYGYSWSNSVDLSQTTVQIGDEPNKVKVGELKVSGTWEWWGVYPYPPSNVKGILKLPASVTDLEVGKLHLGCNLYGHGTLDLGVGSQLQSFTVTNGFYLSYDGGQGRIRGLPTNGVSFTVGQPGAPCPMYIASAYNQRPYGNSGSLVLTNGSFAAYLSRLEIGSGEYQSIYDWYTSGTLNLTNSTLTALDVSGDVYIGCAPLATNNYAPTWKQPKGWVYLPAGTVNIGGNLYVGDTTNSASVGLLELYGTEVQVGEKVQVESFGDVRTYARGASCGLDIASSDTNDFLIATNGNVHISFDANPDDPSGAYWGLRMSGDQVSYFETLNALGRLTWTSQMSSDYDLRFGIHYIAAENKTYIGLSPPWGTLFLLQ